MDQERVVSGKTFEALAGKDKRVSMVFTDAQNLVKFLKGESLEKVTFDNEPMKTTIRPGWRKYYIEPFKTPPLNLVPEGTLVEKKPSLYWQANELFLEDKCKREGITVDEKISKRAERARLKDRLVIKQAGVRFYWEEGR